MSDAAIRPDELASVDPDETQFRTDTLLMHSELVELELYAIRRRLFQDPGLVKLSIGSGQPVEQTVRGYQSDPFNGLIVYNPTPATLSIGFQAGAGLLAPITVPPYTWASFPERYVNVSVALLNPADQQTVIANPVTLLRTKWPPSAGAGAYGNPGATVSQPVVSFNGASAVGHGLALDNGTQRTSHSLIVVTSAGVTAGDVQLAASQDGQNFALIGNPVATPTANDAFATNADGPFRYVRAAITTAITGGTIIATVASA